MLLLILGFFFYADQLIQGQLERELAQFESAEIAPTASSQLPESLLEFMGAHGCTFTPERDLPTRLAGFDPYEVNRLIEQSLGNGMATQQGDYILLDASICTIRLPNIQSDLTVSDPFIQSITTDFDHYDALLKDDEFFAGEDNFGCFLLDRTSAFDERAGGARGAGFDDYIAFVAAAMISGDARFYSPSPLRSPRSLQVMTGAGCDSVPNAASVAASHPFLVSGFGTYIRRLGEGTSCDGSDFVSPGMIAAEIQGADMSPDAPENPAINAILAFEWDLITMAAGWHEGQSGTERGNPRPPLCTYSPE